MEHVVTYDDDCTWRPRQDHEPVRATETADPDPADLTTQVAFPDERPEPVPADTAGLGTVEAFASDGATESSETDSDIAPDEVVEPPPGPAPTRGGRGRKPDVTGADPALAIFVDSSAIVALVDRDDSAHAAAVTAYGDLLAQGYKLFTTNYVIAEAFDLLSTGVGPDVARRFLRDCKLAIYHADEQDERRAKRVVLRQTGPNGLTLTDAVSFVVMERLSVADAFAVDPGFLANAT